MGSRIFLPLLFATILYTGMVSAYDGEYGYNVEDDRVVNLEEVKEPVPADIETSLCTAAMIYSDYYDNGFGMN